MVAVSHSQYADGRTAMPKLWPKFVNGKNVPTAIPNEVIAVIMNEPRLWINGIFGVRKAWSTSVCDHNASTNQPA